MTLPTLLLKRGKNETPVHEKPCFPINARVFLIEKVGGELIWEKFQ
jgi:hypothetical protein